MDRSTLKCYVARYADVKKAYCRKSKEGECKWSLVRNHYKNHGKKEGRRLGCESVDVGRHSSLTTDTRFPEVMLSASTLSMEKRRAPQSWLPHRPRSISGSLSFSVCGGLVNQRLALIDALMIGHLLNAVVILPQLNTNGRQSGSDYDELQKQLVPFTEFFDYNATRTALSPLVQVVLNESEANGYFRGHRRRPRPWRSDVYGGNYPPNWYQKLLRGAQRPSNFHGGSTVRLEFGCTFNSLDKRDDVGKLEELFWRIDAALIPAATLVKSATETINALRARSEARGGTRSFTALHLRVESDWTQHCQRWESNSSIPVRDNCLTNTDRLDRVFAIEGVEERHALYVATEEVGELSSTRGLRNLAHYPLESKSTLFPDGGRGLWFVTHRELSAFHDLLVCEAAGLFVGNSVSTFSAYLELKRERRRRGRADFHYNGGNIPLQAVLFGREWETAARRTLKWVFTINGDASPTFVEAALVAVASARNNTKLVPICVHLGPLGHVAMALQQAGVRVIQHEPRWGPFILEAARNSGDHMRFSTNFLQTNMMLSTFMRFDIPIMGFVDEFVLYADVDVLFLSDISLADFAPLPAFYAVGTEMVDDPEPNGIAFGNAGVMLLNIDAMRRTHDAFISWTFADANIKQALDFHEYGPLDQGAYNAHYQGRFDVHRAPSFNWKPYWGYQPGAKMVHFHGPKVREYLSHQQQVSNDNVNLAAIFDLCDKAVGCYKFVQIWLQYNASRSGLLL